MGRLVVVCFVVLSGSLAAQEPPNQGGLRLTYPPLEFSEQPKYPVPPAIVEYTVDTRVRTAFENKNIDYRVHGPRKIFHITYATKNGRRQGCNVDSVTEMINPNDKHTAYVRRVWSIAYSGPELPPVELLSQLLQQSGDVKVGAWEIIKEPTGDYTLVFDMKIDANTSPDTLVWLTEQTAFIADSTEAAVERLIKQAHRDELDFKPVVDQF